MKKVEQNRTFQCVQGIFMKDVFASCSSTPCRRPFERQFQNEVVQHIPESVLIEVVRPEEMSMWRQIERLLRCQNALFVSDGARKRPEKPKKLIRLARVDVVRRGIAPEVDHMVAVSRGIVVVRRLMAVSRDDDDVIKGTRTDVGRGRKSVRKKRTVMQILL
jgi:hypothetical protein